MPIFLTYNNLLTRGCLPWRPAAVMNRRHFHVAFSWIFKVRYRRNCNALHVPNSISLLEREFERLYRKENSSWISRRRLQVILDYPDEYSYEGLNGSVTEFRNRNRILFHPMGVLLISYFNFYMFVYNLRTLHLHRISLRA